ncbi:hypothetical protein [Cohnella rhizosphaerae]|uniref:Uncharacterized protein n=1 Tax=Cohnella rhizosphaerae TaxID=1457232 RepID=A0A9X4QWI3_9BACL|nr:hypothetical protein [Cohnella rhizosphaerae]MDG0813835.1 hypothetical protein [Cohnella rhizosphaerae]
MIRTVGLLNKPVLVLSMLFTLFAALLFPSQTSATPGQITVNGYTSTSASMSMDSFYPDSDLFPGGRKVTATFDNYAFRFSSGSSGIMVAIKSLATGNVIASPANISSGNTYDIQLDGTYEIHTFPVGYPAPSSWNLQINAQSPGLVDIGSPSPNAYLLKGSTHTIVAFVTGSPTSVTATAVNGSGDTTTLGTLSNITGTRYELTHTFNTHFPVGSGSAMTMPKLRITATYGGATVSKEITFYVTYETRSFYENADATWYYNTPYDHSFLGPANNEQMCYEYIVNQWSVVEPLQPDSYIIDFMLRQGIYSGRAGTVFTSYSMTPAPYPDAIYYGGFHFAKVTAWDASGNPTQIQSKWGPYEYIKSGKANAFPSLYGTPRIYFWD